MSFILYMQKVKASTIAIHLAGWLLFFSFPLVFIDADRNDSIFSLLANPYYWVFCICYFVLFYLNSIYLIPYLLFRKKFFDYGLIIIFLFGCVYFLQPFDKLLNNGPSPQMHRHGFRPEVESPYTDHSSSQIPGNYSFDEGTPPPPPKPEPAPHELFTHIDITSLFVFMMVIALSAATEITQAWQLTEQRAIMAEAGKTSAELSFLKAQINPHFLFNTLNNIYSLAVTQHEHTADSIMKLSNIMRYVTDEVAEDFVPLQHELNCINDYIDLQRLRAGKNTRIEFSINGDTTGKIIAPLIFMTFIENIFKYGISKHKVSTLVIMITCNDQEINLFCQNPVYHQAETSRKGVGITNTRHRLNLLYPAKHFLYINTDGGLFIVDLTLQTA